MLVLKRRAGQKVQITTADRVVIVEVKMVVDNRWVWITVNGHLQGPMQIDDRTHIDIGGGVMLQVFDIRARLAAIGFIADKSVTIDRKEVADKKRGAA